MNRRLYFILPDLDSARRTANELLLARIEDRRMHFLAKRGTPLGELREASYLQKSDLVHAAQLGLILGGLTGFAATLVLAQVLGEAFAHNAWTLVVPVLVCALIGAWAASMIGTSVPNERLKRFAAEIDAGRLLLMVDVPVGQVAEIQDLVHRRHPEVADYGIETAIPAFP